MLMYIFYFGILLWFLSVAFVIWKISVAETCPFEVNSRDWRQQCFEPFLPSTMPIDVKFFVSLDYNFIPRHSHANLQSVGNEGFVWEAKNVTLGGKIFESGDLRIPVPNEVREMDAQQYGWLTLQPTIRNKENNISRPIIVGPIALTGLRIPRRGGDVRNLLEHNDLQKQENQLAPQQSNHWKYSIYPLTIRMVHMNNLCLSSNQLPHLMENLKVRHAMYGNHEYQLQYEPIIFIDDVSHLRWHWREMSRNISTPNPSMIIKIVDTTTLMFAFKKLMVNCIDTMGILFSEDEVEELKYFVSDDRLYYWVLTQIVTLLHCIFEYLAFVDDYSFFVGRKTFRGVSISSLLFGATRSLILFLYLIDLDSSKLILFTVFKDFAFGLYKVFKVYINVYSTPKNQKLVNIWATVDERDEDVPGKREYLEASDDTKNVEKDDDETAKWDKQCVIHGIIYFTPMFMGFSAYCLHLFKYKSWWSWLVSSLADSFYLLGFLHMLPQIYINYKLKSVAHLPIRAFMYKVFNTFIDDVFAFAVKMPLKHRLMTLRDDFVFLIFVLQWFWYRVDHNRVNEYGFRYRKEISPMVDQ